MPFVQSPTASFCARVYISPYEKGNIFNKDPMRPRRLLMHKREIQRLQSKIMQDGFTLIPLSLYFLESRVKVELGLCKGKSFMTSVTQMLSAARREIDKAIKERKQIHE